MGSRLQQLRDTCAGKKRAFPGSIVYPALTVHDVVQGLLAPCKPPPRPRPRTRVVDTFRYGHGFRSDSGSPPCSDASSPPVTPTDGAFADHQRLGGAAPVIYIDILPKASFPPYDVAGGGAPPPCNCCSTSPCANTFGPRHAPRPIQWIDPTITFVSPRIIGKLSSRHFAPRSRSHVARYSCRISIHRPAPRTYGLRRTGFPHPQRPSGRPE